MSVGSPSFGSDPLVFLKNTKQMDRCSSSVPPTLGEGSQEVSDDLGMGVMGKRDPEPGLGWPEGHKNLLRNQP